MSGHVCPWWFAYTFDNPLRCIFHNAEKMLGPYVKKSATVLDIGCGMGYFSIGLAGLVGEKGLVIAADIQTRMLAVVEKRAVRNRVADIIRIHKCEPEILGITTPVDFVLAFWVVHEMPDATLLFGQVRSCMKPGGCMLVVEPKYHVTERRFNQTIDIAESNGWSVSEGPQVRLSRSALLKVNP